MTNNRQSDAPMRVTLRGDRVWTNPEAQLSRNDNWLSRAVMREDVMVDMIKLKLEHDAQSATYPFWPRWVATRPVEKVVVLKMEPRRRQTGE